MWYFRIGVHKYITIDIECKGIKDTKNATNFIYIYILYNWGKKKCTKSNSRNSN